MSSDQTAITALRSFVLSDFHHDHRTVDQTVIAILASPCKSSQSLPDDTWRLISGRAAYELIIPGPNQFTVEDDKLIPVTVGWLAGNVLRHLQASLTNADSTSAMATTIRRELEQQARQLSLWISQQVAEQQQLRFVFAADVDNANARTELSFQALSQDVESKLRSFQLAENTKRLAVAFRRDFELQAKRYERMAIKTGLILVACVALLLGSLHYAFEAIVNDDKFKAIEYYQFVLLLATKISLMVVAGFCVTLLSALALRFVKASMNASHRASVADAMLSVSTEVQDPEIRIHLLRRGGDQIFVPPDDQRAAEKESSTESVMTGSLEAVSKLFEAMKKKGD